MSSTTTLADVANKIAAVVNRGAWNGSITTSGGSVTIPVGYHNGSGKVTGPTLANLIGTNVTLASASNLLSGVTAYGKNGTKYTGTHKCPTTTDLKLVPINYSDGNGTMGGSKFAVYAYGSSYKDCSEKMFNNLSIGGTDISIGSCHVLCKDESTDYVQFYYPTAWKFVYFKWHNASQSGYGINALKFFKASNDGSTWVDVSAQATFRSGAGNSKGGSLVYNGSSFYKYWKMAFGGTHAASNIFPSLVGLYR